MVIFNRISNLYFYKTLVSDTMGKITDGMKSDLATDFLYWRKGIGGMPDSNIIIRTEFECNCYEDWGFVVEKLEFVKLDTDKTPLYKKTILGGGRTLEKAIEDAKKANR